MNKLATICSVAGALVTVVAYAQAANPLTFVGTIGSSAVENNARNSDHPSTLVLTLLDANGDRIKLCNRARLSWNAAVATTNPLAVAIQQLQAAKNKVVLVVSENPDGMYCGVTSVKPI
jgi:hypothetical protein